MSYNAVFFTVSVLFLIASVISLFYLWVNLSNKNLPKVEKLPRNIPLGVIFAAIAIAWCIPQAMDVFSSQATWSFVSIGIICFIIGCLFLDYLFTRALAGILILLAHYLLSRTFAIDIPVEWAVSILLLILGTIGIIIGGIPHYLRNFLRKSCVSKKWKRVAVIFCIIYSFLALYLTIFTALLIK